MEVKGLWKRLACKAVLLYFLLKLIKFIRGEKLAERNAKATKNTNDEQPCQRAACIHSKRILDKFSFFAYNRNGEICDFSGFCQL